MNPQIHSSLMTCLCTAACLAVATARPAAAEDYPNRTIKIVVPVPPGPLLDVVPRIIGEKLSSKWGVPVIIENRPGAAQNLGAEVVAKSDSRWVHVVCLATGPARRQSAPSEQAEL